MIQVTISYIEKRTPDENFTILTYLRGDGYWQFLTPDGSTINIPDHAIRRIEITPSHGEAE